MFHCCVFRLNRQSICASKTLNDLQRSAKFVVVMSCGGVQRFHNKVS